jgi:Ras-related protein Rab-23
MTSRYCKGTFTDSYKKTIGGSRGDVADSLRTIRPLSRLTHSVSRVRPPVCCNAAPLSLSAGVDFLEKSIDTGKGESVKLMIWDTAGQEEFDALTATYYRGEGRGEGKGGKGGRGACIILRAFQHPIARHRSHALATTCLPPPPIPAGAGACAIVFSTTDRASFEAVEKWKKKVADECGDDIVMALVQNKVDLLANAVVTPAEVEALARKVGMRLYRASVKDDLNVKEVFEYLAAQVILKGGDTSGAVAAMGDYSGAAGAGSGAGAGPSSSGKSSGSSAAAEGKRGEGKEGEGKASEEEEDGKREEQRGRTAREEDAAARVSADSRAAAGANGASSAPVISGTSSSGSGSGTVSSGSGSTIKLGADKAAAKPQKKSGAFSFC